MAASDKGFWASLAEQFGQAIASARHEVVEQGWFSRQVTDTGASVGQEGATKPNDLNQTAVNMTVNSDHAIVQVNNGRATLSAGKADFEDQWGVKPPAIGPDRDVPSQDIDR